MQAEFWYDNKATQYEKKYIKNESSEKYPSYNQNLIYKVPNVLNS